MTATVSEAAEVELAIGGMTCASCAARIEKKLNRMDGVEATVNYATEKAKVTFGDDVAVEDLIATVEATGYTAALPEPVRTRPRTATSHQAPTQSRRTSCARCAQRLDHRRRPRRTGHRDGDGRRRCSSSTGSGCR